VRQQTEESRRQSLNQFNRPHDDVHDQAVHQPPGDLARDRVLRDRPTDDRAVGRERGERGRTVWSHIARPGEAWYFWIAPSNARLGQLAAWIALATVDDVGEPLVIANMRQP
jgi:hypothetical protein